MQFHELSRNVASNSQVRCSSGSSKEIHWRSTAGGAIEATAYARQAASRASALPENTADTLGVVQDDLEHLADRLDSVAEELAELGISALRAALEDNDGDGSRPEVEKRITRARRSVEKASVLLRGSHTSGMI